MYKIVFCDIDGTLLDSEHRVRPDTAKRLRRLEAEGVPFVLVSARMPQGVELVRRAYGGVSPMICYSGSLVLDGQGQALFGQGMDREEALRACAFASSFSGISASLYAARRWLARDGEDPWIRQEAAITDARPELGELAALLEGEPCVHKLLCMGPPEQISRLEGALTERFAGLCAYRSKDSYLEVTDARARKSAAALWLCRSLGMGLQDAVAFGDNFNDVDLLRAVGLGVAMGNAPQDVRRQADLVAPSNDEEGVLRCLERLF